MALKRRSQPAKKADNTSSIEYSNLDVGEYEGRLVYVADLGLHTREFRGEQKSPCQKLSLGIEIVDHPISTDDGEIPRIMWTKPFNIFFQLTEKGKEIEYYRLFDMAAVPDTEADWDAQLGKPVSVSVIHAQKDDKTYDNIGNLAAIPSKYQSSVAEASTTPAIGDADDEDNAATKALFGLAKWMYDQRIVEEDAAVEVDYADDIPY